jgi:hypothetical protein
VGYNGNLSFEGYLIMLLFSLGYDASNKAMKIEIKAPGKFSGLVRYVTIAN